VLRISRLTWIKAVQLPEVQSTPMPDAPLILIVEDEADLRTLLLNAVEQYGYRVAAANERSTGAEILRATRPNLLIANVKLRGGNGNDLGKLAHSMGVPVLLISGERTAIIQNENGPIPFLRKPFRLAELKAKLEELIGPPTKDKT
jgi:DNA-binding response OmpR family regulator